MDIALLVLIVTLVSFVVVTTMTQLLNKNSID
jgi:Flp pilus assembly pilin Flp